MLNITFIPKMPSPKTCHMILILLACLTIVPTWVLLLHKHYEAVRILTFLEAFPIVAVFLLGAKGMLSTLTRTATPDTSCLAGRGTIIVSRPGVALVRKQRTQRRRLAIDARGRMLGASPGQPGSCHLP